MGLGVRRRRGTWRSEGGRGPVLCGLLLRDLEGRAPGGAPSRASGGHSAFCLSSWNLAFPVATFGQQPAAGRFASRFGSNPWGRLRRPSFPPVSSYIGGRSTPLHSPARLSENAPAKRCGGTGRWDKPGTRAGGHTTASDTMRGGAWLYAEGVPASGRWADPGMGVADAPRWAGAWGFSEGGGARRRKFRGGGGSPRAGAEVAGGRAA